MMMRRRYLLFQKTLPKIYSTYAVINVFVKGVRLFFEMYFFLNTILEGVKGMKNWPFYQFQGIKNDAEMCHKKAIIIKS